MKKERNSIEFLSFFIVKFILQDSEVGCFHNFDLASVLLLPSSDDRGEESSCKVGSEDRIDLQGQIRDLLFAHIVGQSSFDGLIDYDT